MGEIAVRVTPRSSRNRLERRDAAGWQAWVTAAPTDGQANAAVIDLVAKTLDVPKSSVSIVRGHTSREKVLAIDGISTEALMTRLQ